MATVEEMLTPDQKEAIETGRHISVTAGAGSGKTHILVLKYLRYLKMWPQKGLNQILALTFTNKAAQEMKSRVREKISEIIREEKLSPQERSRWKRIREEIGSAYISTIHGFCARLIKEEPIQSGIDPDFDILQGPDQKMWLEESLSQTLQELEDQRDSTYLSLLTYFPKWKIRKFLTEVILTQPQYPYHKKNFDTWSENEILNYLMEVLVTNRKISKALAEAVKEIEDLEETTPFLEDLLTLAKNYEKISQGQGKPRQLKKQFMEIFFRESGSRLTSFKTPLKGTTDEVKEKINKKLVKVTKQIKKFELLFHREEALRLEDMASEFVQKFHYLLQRTHKNYQEEKKKHHLLDFNDLQLEALQFLKSHPHLRTFRAIMVDEFQDTNQLQWELIELLGREDGETDFFLVGDEKQSIYGFRGAQVEVFSQVRKKLKKMNLAQKEEAQSHEVKLKDNFRSLKAIIDTVNHFFGKLLHPRYHFDSTEPDFVALKCSRQVPGDNPHQGSVEFLLEGLDEGEKLLAEEQREKEGELIANRILEIVNPKHPRGLFVIDGDWNEEDQLETATYEQRTLRGIPEGDRPSYLRPARYEDIAILLRTRTILPQLEEALRRYDIPYFVPSGVGFYQRQEVKDVYAALASLVDTYDDYALLGLLKSPLFAFPEELLYGLGQLKGKTLRKKLNASALYFSHLEDHHTELINLDSSQREARLAEILKGKGISLSQKALAAMAYFYSPLEENYSLTGRELLREASLRLEEWSELSSRLSIAALIREIFETSGYLGALASSQNGVQKVANMEKLLEVARDWDHNQNRGLRAFTRRLRWLIEEEDQEGEAQLETGENAVRIFTIHMSKGLQFPIVFLSQISKNFYHKPTQFLCDSDLGMAVKVPDPQKKYKGQKSPRWMAIENKVRNENFAEEKRLLYVGTTRARDHLIFSGYWDKSAYRQDRSWLSWIREHLGLSPSALEESSHTSQGPPRSLRFQTLPLEPSESALDIPLLTLEDLDSHNQKSRLKPTLYQNDFIASLPGHQAPRQSFMTFEPQGEEEKIIQISPSDLALLSQCPRKYYFERLAGWHASFPYQASAQKRQIDPRLFGDIIHRGLELWLGKDGASREAEEIHLQLQREFSHPDFPREELEKVLSDFRDSSLGQDILAEGEKHPEEPFLARIGPAIVRGTIDLIWKRGDQIWIIDYKTTQIEGKEKKREKVLDRYRIPMSIYTWAMWKRDEHPPEKIRTSLILTENFDDPLDYPHWTEESLVNLEEEITALINNYRTYLGDPRQPMENFPPRHESCHYCPFHHGKLCRLNEKG